MKVNYRLKEFNRWFMNCDYLPGSAIEDAFAAWCGWIDHMEGVEND